MAGDLVIREATHGDIDVIVGMAQQFYATTSYAEICPMEDVQAAGLAILLMDTGVMLVAEHEGVVVGMTGLHIEPFTFNPSVMMATELVFWVNPESRGASVAAQLLSAITAACRDKGCHFIRMMTLHDSPPQAAMLYEREGYAPSEHAFTKRLR